MTSLLPKWLFRIYSRLWVKKKYNWFDFQEAQKITGIKELVKLSKALSLLRSSGWLESKKNKKNPRKREYSLVQIDKIMQDLGKK